MPVNGDVYIQRQKEDILSFLESELQEEFGEDIDLTTSSVFSTFAEALSALDAEQLEPAIQEVFDAAYLESAEGENLEKLVAILGLLRRPASHATGTVEFSASGTVNQSHGIIKGQTVQTDSDDPVEFETTEGVSLFLRDDFEGGSLSADYAGDTANFSVALASGETPPSLQGDYLLKTDGTAGVQITDDTEVTYIGHTMDFYVYVPAGSAPAVKFGDNGSDRYRVHLDDVNGEHRIEKVFDGSTTTENTSAVTLPTGEWLRVQVEWLPDQNGTIRSRIYQDTDGDDLYDELFDTVSVTGENDIELGGFGFREEAGVAAYWDWAADRKVIADARAAAAGTRGNVGADTLTVLPTAPSGVQSVTNRYATGNTARYLTSLRAYTEGLPEESDTELRNRAQASEGEFGFATAPAIIAALRGIDEGGQVQTVTLYENKTNNDNTGSGGLPPKSFEAVVFGTASNQSIADALFNIKGFTSRDYGGAHGSAVSETVDAENGQTFTLNWSEPTEVAVDMSLDLVVNDTYVGDDDIRDRVVEYIGGVLPDGTQVIGTDVGEDVYIDQLEDAIVGPDDTGVIGVDDGGTSFTPSTTTDGNGLEIVSVGADEVATTDGSDGSITITTTEV